MGTDPKWAAVIRNQSYFPLCLAGLNAVPIFFMISGLFTTLATIEKKLSFVDVLRYCLARYARLLAVLTPGLLWGLLRQRPFFFEGGLFCWGKVFSWVGMYGNYNSEMKYWWIDGATLHNWSVVVDFQATVVLIVFTSLVKRIFGEGKLRRAYVCALVTSVLLRANIVLKDKCLNLVEVLGVWHPGVSFLLGTNDGQAFMEQVYDAPYGKFVVDTGNCVMRNDDHMHNYAVKSYLPLHMRIAPFFVGALFATRLKTPTEDVKSSFAYRIASIWIIASLFLPLDVDSLPPPAALLFLEIFGHVLLSAAVATVTYYTLTPQAHACHAPITKRLMSLPFFKFAGQLSPWIYALHWPILFEVLRFVKFEPSILAGLALSLAVLAASAILAYFMVRNVDPILSRALKIIKGHPKAN